MPSPTSAPEFDHVVVGGGTAVAVATAARLSEDPDVSVCLLESGPPDVGAQSTQGLRRTSGANGSAPPGGCAPDGAEWCRGPGASPRRDAPHPGVSRGSRAPG